LRQCSPSLPTHTYTDQSDDITGVPQAQNDTNSGEKRRISGTVGDLSVGFLYTYHPGYPAFFDLFRAFNGLLILARKLHVAGIGLFGLGRHIL
jgi:hypothetical protein